MIWRHPISGEPFYAEKSALKILGRIQSEIDEKTFNPAAYRQKNPLLVPAYAVRWLSLIDVSPNTSKSYNGFIRNYISPFFAKTDIRKIRYVHLVEFKKWLKSDKGLSDKTIYNCVSCLRTLLRWAWKAEDIASVPPFPVLSYEKPEIEYLTLDQQAEIFGHIPAEHRPIFEFMAEYGLRIGEGRALKKDCISGGYVTIKRNFGGNNTLRETTKTGKIRRYELTDYAEKIINSIPAHLSPFVFQRGDGQAYTSKDLNRIWKSACEKAGIKIKLSNGIRHSLGCQLADMGCDMDLIREQLGHTKIEMTLRYAKRSKSRLTDALTARRGNVLNFKDKK